MPVCERAGFWLLATVSCSLCVLEPGWAGCTDSGGTCRDSRAATVLGRGATGVWHLQPHMEPRRRMNSSAVHHQGNSYPQSLKLGNTIQSTRSGGSFWAFPILSLLLACKTRPRAVPEVPLGPGTNSGICLLPAPSEQLQPLQLRGAGPQSEAVRGCVMGIQDRQTGAQSQRVLLFPEASEKFWIRQEQGAFAKCKELPLIIHKANPTVGHRNCFKTSWVYF